MEAFRYNNLVYIPITKHASTSYRHLFRDVLHWQEIQSDEINWTVDHVFAHLLHPYTRHLKGITECILKYNLDRKSTRLNSSNRSLSRMPSSA